MKKIPSLFKRDYEGARLVYDEVVPGSEWVINGEGIATRKWDGTSCMIKDGKLYKRYDVKKNRLPPNDGIPCEPAPDPNTGHWPWWVPVGEGKEDKYFREALSYTLYASPDGLEDGTYELVGPKINGNRDMIKEHVLIKHGIDHLQAPRTFDELKEYLGNMNIEGIVWHHPDGRMVKIKKRDFGYKW